MTLIEALIHLQDLLRRRDDAIKKAQTREDFESGHYERYDEMVADWNEDVVDVAEHVVDRAESEGLI
jgi:hypothetical protein